MASKFRQISTCIILYAKKRQNYDFVIPENVTKKNMDRHIKEMNKFNAEIRAARASRLSFDEFKKMNIESFDEYCKSPEIKHICKNDVEKMKIGYEGYCICEYNDYLQTLYGGNPALMI